ncbi:MAG: hypothetical protein ACKVU4_07920 [Phycisphaerales bacterium]
MDDAALATHWLDAARNLAVAAELEGVYAAVAAEIEARGPACWASGRCCNFAKTGHRLYVTGLEAAYTVSRLATNAAREASTSPLRVLGAAPRPPELTAASLADARARGGCPFQVLNLCGAHAIRPLGCRVYFCDRSTQEWQRELSERAIERIKSLHERRAIAYRYAEWRGLLELFIAARA